MSASTEKINITINSLVKTYFKRSIKDLNPLDNFDVFYDKTTKFCSLRGEYKSFKNADKNLLQEHPKKINGFTCDKFNKNPLESFNSLSNLQEYIVNNSNDFLWQGFQCLTASCGDGKTMSAIYLMHILKVKTLIISNRNAVNDQWESELKNLYPDLNIVSRIEPDPKDKKNNSQKENLEKTVKKTKRSTKKINKTIQNEDIDVMICTPQYIVPKLLQFKSNKEFFKNFNFDLIIYDEIHSLLSEQFSMALALPFVLKMNNYITYLPYMLSLTASLPNTTEKEYKIIKTIFGEPIKFESKITSIPVYYTDYRDMVPNRNKFDTNYIAMDDRQASDYYIDLMISKEILPSIDFKLIIMTSTIDSTIYSGINSCIKFNLPVLIIRANNEPSIYLTPDKIPDIYRDLEEQSELPEYTLEEVKSREGITLYKNYKEALDKSAIIVGTYHRLKEGFNCKNIVYGIITKFIWSETSRVQILGRIRRSSENEQLNKHRRIFMVSSGRIPSNVGHRQPYEKLEIKYNQKYEDDLFKKENYIKITEDEL